MNITTPDASVIAQGIGLPEGPRFHDRHLYYSDASAGGVWRIRIEGDEHGEPEPVVLHRRGIAGLALHADGGVVVSGRNLAWKRGEDTTVLAEVGLANQYARFNDLEVSPAGRVYAGSIDYDPTGLTEPELGTLELVDLDGTVRPVSDRIEQSNGLGFAPDGRTLYHVDSGPRIVRAYEVHDDGGLGAWRELHHWDEGIPDGMAVAADGSLWVALGDAGTRGFVSVVEPDGTERERLEMPHPGMKSLCFGGDDLRTLFVTLGGDLEAKQRDGSVLAVAVDVPGIADTLARVRPSGA